MSVLERTISYMKLLRKYNSLENKYETLKEDVSNDCFNKLINRLGEPIENKILREENKRLRSRIKELKKNQKL